MEKISSAQFCREFVRRENHDLYLLHFFAPRVKRRLILAVMALHVELRIIPKKVSDPTMRLIRLKWWEEEIVKIQNTLPHADSPVLNEIATRPPLANFDDYFNRFDASFRGEDADIDEALYAIFGAIINDDKANNRFSNKLFLHDNMPENAKFRAFRLWLGV